MHFDKETNNVNVTFELPGLQKKDVSIDVHNDVLTVSGEDKTFSERSEGGYVVRERRYGKFSRSLSLPHGLKVGTFAVITRMAEILIHEFLFVQNEDIKASMTNGVLNIVFPKSTPDTEPKKVTIA